MSTPAERLRHELAARRALGESFEKAWVLGRPIALVGAGRDWEKAIAGTREAWRSAYLGELSTHGASAALLLADAA